MIREFKQGEEELELQRARESTFQADESSCRIKRMLPATFIKAVAMAVSLLSMNKYRLDSSSVNEIGLIKTTCLEMAETAVRSIAVRKCSKQEAASREHRGFSNC